MIWCIVILTGALESNVPRMCFPERDQCRAFIMALDLDHAQCSQRVKRD